MAGSHSTQSSKDTKAQQAEGHLPKHPDQAMLAGVEAEFLGLQRSVGNKAVGQMLESGHADAESEGESTSTRRVSRVP